MQRLSSWVSSDQALRHLLHVVFEVPVHSKISTKADFLVALENEILKKNCLNQNSGLFQQSLPLGGGGGDLKAISNLVGISESDIVAYIEKVREKQRLKTERKNTVEWFRGSPLGSLQIKL